MSLQELKTFSVEGDTEVSKYIVRQVSSAGFSQVKTSEADVVLSYCLSVPDLEDLYYDADGLLQTTKHGALLIDLSPSTVSFACELNALGVVNDRLVLDAPLVVRDVVRDDPFAHRDNVSIVVGGSEEVFKQARPLLDAIASRVMWMGKAGMGQSTKIALTLTTSAALVGIVEAFVSLASSEAPLDQEEYLEVASALRFLTPEQETFIQAMINNEVEGSSYTLEYMMADLAAALSSVDDSDIILPQAESGFRLMELLAMVGGISFSPAALRLVFADEQTSQKYGLDWSRAEGAYDDHECDCDHDDPDHECTCGHDHDHHHHDQSPTNFIGFSSN